ncbi:hypothetical protein SARC_08431 [Sphaeroforma arctica JP610]|uniref:Uncharacterized protein n=1 Tax=Sphaeroforma arctica JP610 TaxID=667725 RepID=A0A0L0FQU1_9EUKA|nr:hypothetical protein SARC_08431 [Sphaeroforma arctica JP610]KNC79167.1 hypothetical protein SARC_08431 [Sphaeroforma arctica JP610]|eukprot:XP_014153069.1 hypothetical protein SARC_08431 [Sphaeroforma arctica JP610]
MTSMIFAKQMSPRRYPPDSEVAVNVVQSFNTEFPAGIAERATTTIRTPMGVVEQVSEHVSLGEISTHIAIAEQTTIQEVSHSLNTAGEVPESKSVKSESQSITGIEGRLPNVGPDGLEPSVASNADPDSETDSGSDSDSDSDSEFEWKRGK